MSLHELTLGSFLLFRDKFLKVSIKFYTVPSVIPSSKNLNSTSCVCVCQRVSQFKIPRGTSAALEFGLWAVFIMLRNMEPWKLLGMV